ncbi:Calcium/calmodulin dependent protein kinase II association-domain protein [Cyanobacterium stanieri PCC 7202]|uniref:Calcium/calmodulin dependent protein kinase II association-domain protein n=1 Tax=Cyanobacterium stanieri (strain ATCC 29140 / PCC 7202) TaxID=292563 RepID=K9YJQ0_CYASC|nr:Calcium/calmodulin dependent protein kinase II association-domain protein [Cyanobacterium stanieri PCC 7202]
MKILSLLGLCSSLLTLGMNVPATFAQDYEADAEVETTNAICERVTEEDIASLFDRWNESLGTGNPENVVTNYAENAILLATVSNNPKLNTEDKIEYFERFLENKPIGTIDQRTIFIGCNTAVDSGLYTFTFNKTGEEVQARYSYTYTWDGSEWLIINHHSSKLPETES